MKRPLKIVIIVLSVITGILLLVAVLISPIAHAYIEKNSKELTGRVIKMDKLRINIFAGTVFVKNFKTLEANDKDEFLTFDKLKVNLSLFRLLSNELRFTEITLVGPKVFILQNENNFNFSDIIEKFSSSDKDSEKNESENGFDIDLRNISLQNGNVIYRDLVVNSFFDMKNLQLAIPRIFFSGKNTDVGLKLNFGDNGGTLDLRLFYSMDKEKYELNVNLNGFALAPVQPYLEKFLNINTFDGKLTALINVKGSLKHIMELAAKGDILLQNLHLTDTVNNELLFVNNLHLNIEELDLMNNKFYFDKFDIQGLKMNYDIFEDRNTFSHLFVEKDENTPEDSLTQPQTSQEKKQIDLKIKNFSISESDVIYADHTLKQDFILPVANIAVTSGNISFNEQFAVTLSALVGEKGELAGKWQGSFENFGNQKFNLRLNNFKLTDVSPYTVHYTAFPVKEGLLSLKSSASITNNHLSNVNVIDIYKCKVENKLKNMEPEFKVPLKAALYILTDRKGKIKIELPVKGNINSPEFSYRKIIFKTLLNLFVKVVASPIDAIIKALGVEEDVFKEIQLDINSYDIGSENYAQLNKMVEVLKIKPELKLTLQQNLNQEENIRELALFSVKRDFYLAVNSDKNINSLQLQDFINIRNIKNKNPEFQLFLNKKITSSIEQDEQGKAMTLFDLNNLREESSKKITFRNKLFTDYFAAQGIPAENLEFLPANDTNPANGKVTCIFNLKMQESDNENSEPQNNE